jgi:hypothetical protein
LLSKIGKTWGMLYLTDEVSGAVSGVPGGFQQEHHGSRRRVSENVGLNVGLALGVMVSLSLGHLVMCIGGIHTTFLCTSCGPLFHSSTS